MFDMGADTPPAVSQGSPLNQIVDSTGEWNNI